ncbi:MAG: hypothetical protein JXD21_07100 [Candidatus Omnitrophica bacterium]|nr:hypothetical protein [Candidatus Omnitrophota bacterium]
MKFFLLMMTIIFGSIGPVQSQTTLELEEYQGFSIIYSEVDRNLPEQILISVLDNNLFYNVQELSDGPDPKNWEPQVLQPWQLRKYKYWADQYNLCDIIPPEPIDNLEIDISVFYSLLIQYDAEDKCTITWNDQSVWGRRTDERNVEKAVRELKSLTKTFAK